jgi:drug/metabolite transporter (DMT)-like permease
MSEQIKVTVPKLVAAFLAVYIIWGSTYFAIAVAIESLPPLLMAAARFLVAGAILFAWASWRGAARPTLREWRSAAIVGTLLLLGGNGAVVLAETRVASGAVALLVATVPLWMVLLAWIWKGGGRPDWRVWAGIGLGLTGILVLVGPDALGAGKVDALGAVTVLGGALAWATGSIYSRSATLPKSPLLATGMEMLAGGGALLMVGLARGELAGTHLELVTLRSVVALGYLVVFGSLVGFTAYIWLLKATTPARAATYAYVNPVVAVLLGWAFAGAALSGRTMLSALVVLAAVALITVRGASPAAPPEEPKVRLPIGQATPSRAVSR